MRKWGVLAGVGACVALCGVDSPLHHMEGLGSRPAYAAGVAALMAVWWLTEAVPMGVAACVPLLLFPLLGVIPGGVVPNVVLAGAPFLDAYILLFLGGMVLGAALEECGLHRRVALHVMLLVGTQPARLLLGLLGATALVSMWISNTATAVMMLPIATAVLKQLETLHGGRRLNGMGAALMLAVAYGSNIGGVGTKIGTGTNSIFCGYAARVLGRDLGFLEFMACATPVVMVLVPVAWRVLWLLARDDHMEKSPGDVLSRSLEALGTMSRMEKRVGVLFLTAAVLWISGDWVRPWLGPSLTQLLGGRPWLGKHHEALVAMLVGLAALLMGAAPWRRLKALPWETLLLLGGSFAMAAGLESSGFSAWMGRELEGLAGLPRIPQVLMAVGGTVLLSAVASNTATINVMLSVLPKDLPLLLGACIGASCDFALPAGTPPNAIVFGSGYVRLPVMMRTGLVLDILAVIIVSAFVVLWFPLVLG